jgi:AmmeMemoRadiSam system protein A
MLNAEEKTTLLKLATDSIQYGLKHQAVMSVELNDYPDSLQQIGATFITLTIQQQLRGCIGTLEAYRPLVIDVIENAYAAAFRDPRFSPVNNTEFNLLEYHISLLQPSVEMQFDSEEDLLQQIQPGTDGLIFNSDGRRATFLPSVWEQLPEPTEFINHLKIKAGFDKSYWSPDIKVSRYHVDEFS